ncbi:MAG: LysR family transcriptional regulator [Pseudomonadota bacterium]
MKTLSDIRIFLALSKRLSISKVADQFELTPAAVSASLKRLEAELDVVLFVRSTRKMRLSEAGVTFLPFAEKAIDSLHAGIQASHNTPASFKGTIKVSVPSDLGRNVIVPHLDRFLVEYPNVNLRLYVSDENTNLYSSDVDFAIRYGVPASSNLIARPLVRDNYRIVCASPSYLSQNAFPYKPVQLKAHTCATFMRNNAIFNEWHFYQDEQHLKLKVHCQQVMNDGELVRRWAVNGNGIVCKSALDVASDIDENRLVRVCPDWRCDDLPLYLLYADRRQMTPIAKSFYESLKHLFDST